MCIEIVLDKGTAFGNAICHVAFDASKGVSAGLHNYGENDDELDSDRDSENEDSDDDDVPYLYSRNHEDTDSSDHEVEGNLHREFIAKKKTLIFKDSIERLDYKHHKVSGVNDQNHQDAIDIVFKSRKIFFKRDQRKADVVRRFQYAAGCPSDQTTSC